ncbi:pilus assembly protein TadE [Arthrobacter sp. Soil782]|uniref:TadE/TadG family type IV pilus assembly protein n=1 Tax=Arthrobacter sp. Soil782 TaxID=1736410 RepID=UPI0006FD7A48|nr:TadE/TadG family type IV pilus assembly protein [Arthrobacter sp. Soil782]KRF08447.1 pilus assembly protein TadE [Arthrobacter sp. Soil782]
MKRDDRGAVAVEMALLLPVLVLLLLGIMEFGRAYNAQVTLTNAAREGVRVMAITNVRADARTAAKNVATTLALTDSSFTFNTTPASSPATCAAGRQVTVTISYSLDTLTGIAGPFSMTGKGVMQCGG